jgi:cob(I)alamin adenosyltransferase
LLVVNTGNGKGKSTAAFGVLFRAWGYGMPVAVMQFMKPKTGRFGEVRAAEKLQIEWMSAGDGFTWMSKDQDQSVEKARYGWQRAKAIIEANEHAVVVLDELTYPLSLGWIDTGEAVEWLLNRKPRQMHVVITGRNAPPQLVEAADLVTEMREVKHPMRELGMRAQRGLDY